MTEVKGPSAEETGAVSAQKPVESSEQKSPFHMSRLQFLRDLVKPFAVGTAGVAAGLDPDKLKLQLPPVQQAETAVAAANPAAGEVKNTTGESRQETGPTQEDFLRFKTSLEEHLNLDAMPWLKRVLERPMPPEVFDGVKHENYRFEGDTVEQYFLYPQPPEKDAEGNITTPPLVICSRDSLSGQAAEGLKPGEQLDSTYIKLHITPQGEIGKENGQELIPVEKLKEFGDRMVKNKRSDWEVVDAQAQLNMWVEVPEGSGTPVVDDERSPASIHSGGDRTDIAGYDPYEVSLFFGNNIGGKNRVINHQDQTFQDSAFYFASTGDALIVSKTHKAPETRKTPR